MDEESAAHCCTEMVSVSDRLPGLINRAGGQARQRFLEFFTANIRNPGTRAVYAHVIRGFCRWCELQAIALEKVGPIAVGTYIEQLANHRSAPTVKLHLAAIRMLFDYLV